MNPLTRILTLAVSLFTTVQLAYAELATELSFDYNSKYVWRGTIVNDEPVLQPSLTLSLGDLALNVWGNYDLTNGGRKSNFSEVDYTLSYSLPIEDVSVEAGVIYYDFPGLGSEAETAEGYISLGLSTILAPSLAVYYDFDAIDGWYINGGISHGFELTENLGLELGASLGWGSDDYNEGYYGHDDGELNDLAVYASLGYAVNENCSIAATLTYSELVGSDIEDLVADPDAVIFGVNFTYGF